MGHKIVNGEVVELTAGEEAQEAERATAWAAGQAQREAEFLAEYRRSRYVTESDPLFFKQQRGEVPAGTWEAKVAEIKASVPKPALG